jgi:integrase/recombinase XerD
VRLPQAYDLFVRERRFITNVSPKTLDWYKNSWQAFSRHVDSNSLIADLDSAQLKAATIGLAASGLKAVSVNTHLRAINAFLNWAHQEGLLPKRLRAARLITEQKLPDILSPDQITVLLAVKPDGFAQQRTHALAMLILDTGLRLSECLNLQRSSIDQDQSTIQVLGKGRRHRIVPVSSRMLGHLFRWLRRHSDDVVFPRMAGGPMKSRMVLTNFKALQLCAGITDVRFSPHTLRHTFASYYIKNGGGEFRLQRILGHTTLEMTRRYVQLQTEDLSEVHDSLSVLSVGPNRKR